MIFDVAMSRLRQPGMDWYCAKLAENNPDETHWTFRRFVEHPTPGFVAWQPTTPENVAHLPPTYYEDLRAIWAHRPDIVKRFVEGKYGYQQQGRAVTPEWSDDIHLATGLRPVPGVPLTMLWDFGLNPTCLITQVTPLGQWLFIEALVGEDMGVFELIQLVVKPTLSQRYRKFTWNHIGDPAGMQREQSSSVQSAVLVIKKELGGTWRPGPQKWKPRIDPLRAALRQTRRGQGLILVDRLKAKPVWHAFRGGWHYNVTRTGIVSTEPLKDIHSHPGDAASYGAAVLFPLGRLRGKARSKPVPHASFFKSGPLGFERPNARVPREARMLKP
jgi:hypothetical protein